MVHGEQMVILPYNQNMTICQHNVDDSKTIAIMRMSIKCKSNVIFNDSILSSNWIIVYDS